MGSVACVALAAPSSAEPPEGDAALTNYAVWRRTVQEAVAEMLTREPFAGDETILVVPGEDHARNSAVGELIAAELVRRGYRVHVQDAPLAGSTPTEEASPDDSAGAAETDAAAAMLQHLQGLEGAIATPAGAPDGPMPAPRPSHSGAPAGGDVLEYRLGLSEVKYIDESRAFLLGPKRVQRGAAVQVTCRLKDGDTDDLLWVSEGAATYLDAIPKGKLAIFESDGFAPERVTGRGMMRVVEPVVVGGIVAGLVVLFYTNQN
jgi:hypothetical protein